MVINPQYIIDEKILSSFHEWYPLSEEQIQANGIDVRIKSVQQLGGDFTLSRYPFKKYDFNFEKTELFIDDDGFFKFECAVPYSIECFESVKIPKNVAAMVYGRSSLNRRGIFIRSSFYDSGFSNTIGFTLYPWIDCKIQIQARVAQIVFFRADSKDLYNGQYQGGK